MPANTWVESKKEVETVKKSQALIDWIKENRETFWGSVAVIAATIAFVIFFTASYAKTQKNAWQALFIAQQNAYAGKIDEAKKISSDLIKNYSRSSAVPFAIMLEGDLDFAKGKFEEAEKSYRLAMKKAENTLLPVLLFNVGKTFEARHNWEETIKTYESFMKKYNSHYTAPEVYMNLAAAYARSGKSEEAKTAFSKITVLYPDTIWAQQAKAILNPPVKEQPKTGKKQTKK